MKDEDHLSEEQLPGKKGDRGRSAKDNRQKQRSGLGVNGGR